MCFGYDKTIIAQVFKIKLVSIYSEISRNTNICSKLFNTQTINTNICLNRNPFPTSNLI